jgi:hypothetical protein
MQGMVIVVEWTGQCGSSLIQTDEELLEQQIVREVGGGRERNADGEEVAFISEREKMHMKFSLHSLPH